MLLPANDTRLYNLKDKGLVKVSFQRKNLDFLSKNPNFLFLFLFLIRKTIEKC